MKGGGRRKQTFRHASTTRALREHKHRRTHKTIALSTKARTNKRLVP